MPRIGRKPCRHRFLQLVCASPLAFYADPITIVVCWLQRSTVTASPPRSPAQHVGVKIMVVFDIHCAQKFLGLWRMSCPPHPAVWIRERVGGRCAGGGPWFSQLPARARRTAFGSGWGSRWCRPCLSGGGVAATAFDCCEKTPMRQPCGQRLPWWTLSHRLKMPSGRTSRLSASRVRRILALWHHAHQLVSAEVRSMQNPQPQGFDQPQPMTINRQASPAPPLHYSFADTERTLPPRLSAPNGSRGACGLCACTNPPPAPRSAISEHVP